MAAEIERKFLVASLPSELQLGSGTRLRQGYLALDGAVEVRLRITAASSVLTVKAGRGLTRTEVEAVIDRSDAEALWLHTDGRRLEKVRHRVDAGDHVADVDVYSGPLAGLCTAEVEFASEQEAGAFVPPAWFGTELTGVTGWDNASLARHGRPA